MLTIITKQTNPMTNYKLLNNRMRSKCRFCFVCLFVCLMVFNATFNNISVISWHSGLRYSQDMVVINPNIVVSISASITEIKLTITHLHRFTSTQ